MIIERTPWQPGYLAPDVKVSIANVVDSAPTNDLSLRPASAKRLLEELTKLATNIILQTITKVD